jgi:hypothetical protein
MRKAITATSKPIPPPPEPAFNVFFVIAAILTLFVPILVLPAVVDNAFNTPESVLIPLGVCLMGAIYSVQLFRGREVPVSGSAVPKLMLLVLLLNFFSFIYTKNYYYTNVAVSMNVASVLFMFFLSLHLSGRNALRLLVLTPLSGVLVPKESKAAIECSLYYNPLFTEAKEKLHEVNKVIQEHHKVMIKFR